MYFFEGPYFLANEPEAPETAVQLDVPHPNPAREGSTLRYTLSEAGPSTLAVYDLLGRRIATLVDGLQVAGPHEVAFATGTLPSGVYVLRLVASGRVATAKLTVAR